MLEFQEKRRVKKFFYSRVTLAILIIVVLYSVSAVWKVYQKQDMTKDNLAKTAASLASLQAREKMLSSEVERLKTEAGREAEIREKFGLVKPGEEVIVVVDKDDSRGQGTTTPTVGFWGKVMNWFR
jgi:cell division protein FtsB